MTFRIEKTLPRGLGRVGTFETPHGILHTPAFVVVGTKATVKALSPRDVREVGAEAVLANTYHLYLEPGEAIVQEAGGLHSFMNWDGPIFTDSGGFQVFSLGEAFGKGVSKFASEEDFRSPEGMHPSQVTICEEGVEFRSPKDGSKHFLSPERSIEIQHALGADVIFAFDECTSPNHTEEYLRESMERTHRWAARSLAHHIQRGSTQFLFGIVQGGNSEALRRESARTLASMDFDGFGIGGSFTKKDLERVLSIVNSLLPEDKPRHLLGIGEPIDLFLGVENGCDTFDCVTPTRIARNGTLYTHEGKINIENARFRKDFSPIEESCRCLTCRNYTRAYLSHLFRSNEMYAATLASIHNLHFILSLVRKIRESILDDTYPEYREQFLSHFYA